jgi:hypothetical protein
MLKKTEIALPRIQAYTAREISAVAQAPSLPTANCRGSTYRVERVCDVK